jgi:smad nuclear-interacting protein 1
MSSGHKRNRWGGPPPPRQASSAAHQATTISDQDALAALLSAAHKNEEERTQRNEGKNSSEQSSFKRQKEDSKRSSQNSNSRSNDDYYGPSGSTGRNPDNRDRLGKQEDSPKEDDDETAVEKQKPNFALSGALASDETKGNLYKGVLLKFQEPPNARTPNTQWRFYVFKGEEQLETLHVSKQSAYLIGRNEEIADICVQHPSCSAQHAVLQYRAVPTADGTRLNCLPYIMDLEATNGTFLNDVRIDAARYYQLKKGDVLKFGASTREYVLLTANTTALK